LKLTKDVRLALHSEPKFEFRLEEELIFCIQCTSKNIFLMTNVSMLVFMLVFSPLP